MLIESRPAMNPTRLLTVRSAVGAAWSLALGFGGVAAKSLAGTGPAPV